jgi:hypothetical protein
MQGYSKHLSLALATFVFTGGMLAARPAAAQATYEYTGNPFTLFSCGPNSTNTGTLGCATPAPTNPLTSYTATDRVTATLTLDVALPASMPLTDVRTFAGFLLTMSDGQHTVTNLQQVGMFAQVATDASGQIVQWRLVINTGGTLNGGISTSNTPFLADTGTLACCHPTVPGNFGQVFGNPGTWTMDTARTPSEAVVDLMDVVSDPGTGLSTGQINSLNDKLSNALASIDAGLNKQAINQLQAFISSVESSVKNGKIAAADGAALIASATDIIGML